MRRDSFLKGVIFTLFVAGCLSSIWIMILRMPSCDYYNYVWNSKGGLVDPLSKAVRRVYESWTENKTKLNITVKIPDIGTNKTVYLFVLSRGAENYLCAVIATEKCHFFEESGIGHIKVRVERDIFKEGEIEVYIEDDIVILSSPSYHMTGD
jgi:hypothetical protein